MARKPLADFIRPDSFDLIVGQSHLFGQNGVIKRALSRGYVPNMIFFGPPGTGKTTAANIIAKQSNMTIRHLNATTASLADVKQVCSETAGIFGSQGILLYLDEIQYFNKKQQQSLLEFIEDGRITLIASTTENPYMYVYNAIISRSAVFEFKAVSESDMLPCLKRALGFLNEQNKEEKSASDEVLLHIAALACGDVRRSLGILENVYFCADTTLTVEDADRIVPSNVGSFDKDGTVHYDLLSALQKSIRGSDPDAAIFYLARILEGGDLAGACRRLQVIASEDIGLAYPLAAVVTDSCVNAALRLGMPEASIPLSNATVLLATSPKSNSAHVAYELAKADINAGLGQNIPPHLRQLTNFKGYKYPHDFKNRYVEQQYMPDDLVKKSYYSYAENKNEQSAKLYWEAIKGKKAENKDG